MLNDIEIPEYDSTADLLELVRCIFGLIFLYLRCLSYYQNHSSWIAMGLSIGIPKHLVEDFVHEMYLRLNKYVGDPQKDNV